MSARHHGIPSRRSSMSSVVIILIFVVLALFIVVATELRERRRGKLTEKGQPESAVSQPAADTECCGRHAVCEKNSLLSSKPDITYYDDEELDAFSGRDAATYTAEEKALINEVFVTLNEEDVAGWLRSLRLREIELPDEIREEALMIVSDRRFAATPQ